MLKPYAGPMSFSSMRRASSALMYVGAPAGEDPIATVEALPREIVTPGEGGWGLRNGEGAGAARGARDATGEETSRDVDRERPRGEHSGPRRAARVLRQRPVATRPGCPTGKCRKISESALLWNP